MARKRTKNQAPTPAGKARSDIREGGPANGA